MSTRCQYTISLRKISHMASLYQRTVCGKSRRKSVKNALGALWEISGRPLGALRLGWWTRWDFIGQGVILSLDGGAEARED